MINIGTLLPWWICAAIETKFGILIQKVRTEVALRIPRFAPCVWNRSIRVNQIENDEYSSVTEAFGWMFVGAASCITSLQQKQGFLQRKSES